MTARHKVSNNRAVPAAADLGDAFKDLEPEINNVYRMAELTKMAAEDEDRELMVFAIHHLRDMIAEFRQRYYDSYKAGTLHLAVDNVPGGKIAN